MTQFLRAAAFLLLDLMSTLAFAGVFALTHSIYAATALGAAIGLGQICWELARGKRPDAMQWMSLGLVALFGGATLFTHNPMFIKLKPVLIYLIVAAFMCVPGWMSRYMPQIVLDHAPEIPRAFGFIWAGLMFTTAVATLIIAFRFDDRTYAAYLASFPLASKLALFGVQYATTRILVRRRIMARLAAEPLGDGSPALG